MIRKAALLLTFTLAACAHTPSPKEQEAARIRYDLGVEATQQGNIRQAVVEFEKALEKDPRFADAHNALGLLYHLSLGRPDKAERAYRRAIELRPDFSEAANNLGTLFLAQGRYVDAEEMFRRALDDVLYPTPHLARGNLGWALYKQGRMEEAIVELRSAVLTQPQFCQGYRNLGLIYRDLGRDRDAEVALTRFKESCPETPEAHYEWANQQARAGRTAQAAEGYLQCVDLAGGTGIGPKCAEARASLAEGRRTGD